MTIKAIFSIVLFILVYVVLFALALGLTLVCCYFGLNIILSHPSFGSILFGLGVISIGFMILIFLIKFIFKKHTIDRSHLIEITEEQEPKLFAFIKEIVDEVKTDFPKKIYISADVNACVFYDSNFWSMFLPIKKNLQIGIGLVNSVSSDEFKAILAHEFGHFSQKTMKVGSYVHNVNQVIFNMLGENDSYSEWAEKLASIHGFIALSVAFAVKIVRGIQWILGKIYGIVNLSYMALSREMEFHADQVAAYTAGSKPLITSLLRLDLANQSYNTVLNYYDGKISESVKTKNIYPQHQYVMNFLANKSQLPIENNLPQVSLEDFSRYNKSKLVIKDQWASHPSTEDRVLELEKLNIDAPVSQAAAASLFKNIVELQKKATDKLFSEVKYEKEIRFLEKDAFVKDFSKQYKEGSFSDGYNSYYDDKNPVAFDLETVLAEINKYPVPKKENIFGKESVDAIYTVMALQNDIHRLHEIADKTLPIKSFDYDGTRYSAKKTSDLIPILEKELADINTKIVENDKAIFSYYYAVAKQQGMEETLKDHYKQFFEVNALYNEKIEILTEMVKATEFMHQTLQNEAINAHVVALEAVEKTFKLDIQNLLKQDLPYLAMTDEMKEIFTLYTSKYWIYFTKMSYQNGALDVLFTTLRFYNDMLGKTYFNSKKDLLNFQDGLEKINDSTIKTFITG